MAEGVGVATVGENLGELRGEKRGGTKRAVPVAHDGGEDVLQRKDRPSAIEAFFFISQFASTPLTMAQ